MPALTVVRSLSFRTAGGEFDIEMRPATPQDPRDRHAFIRVRRSGEAGDAYTLRLNKFEATKFVRGMAGVDLKAAYEAVTELIGRNE